jgi:Tfp pilus assembly protein PilN
MRRLGINLATTPFVNRFVPAAALAGLGGAALLLTVLNIGSFIVLGREYRSDRAMLQKQEQRLDSLQKDLQAKQRVLDSAGVSTFSQEAQFVAEILKAKRFSWTQFLTDLERVKPYGLMFESVSPSISSSGAITVSFKGVANPREELIKLETNLFNDASFREVKLLSESKDTSNPWTHFQLTCQYIPEAHHAP